MIWRQIWNVTTPGSALYLQSGGRKRDFATKEEALASLPSDFAVITAGGERVWLHWCVGVAA